MNDSKLSGIESPFWKSFDKQTGWPVPEEWAQELFNYIVLGFRPGSFHTALIAMDLKGSVIHSHEMNTWPAIRVFCKWLVNIAPPQAYGSYEKVDAWLKLSREERIRILEEKKLLFTEKEMTWKILTK